MSEATEERSSCRFTANKNFVEGRNNAIQDVNIGVALQKWDKTKTNEKLGVWVKRLAMHGSTPHLVRANERIDFRRMDDGGEGEKLEFNSSTSDVDDMLHYSLTIYC